jgi:hypothetical protein
MKKIITVFFILVWPVIVFAQGQTDTCKALYKDIENDLAEANYCFQDSDCEVLELGGKLIKFGCYHFVNQSTDKEAIYTKMNDYYGQCEQLINDCAKYPKPVCVNNKCVASEEPVVEVTIQ